MNTDYREHSEEVRLMHDGVNDESPSETRGAGGPATE